MIGPNALRRPDKRKRFALASLITVGALAIGIREARRRGPVQREVLAMLGAFEDAFDRRDAAAFVALYATHPETTYIFGNRAFVGRKAIEDEYRRTFFAERAGESRLTLELVNLLFVGRHIVATARAVVSADLAHPLFDGTATLVLKQQKGRWRVLYDNTA